MNRVQNVTIILCLFFSAYASLASDALNFIALYVVLPVALLFSFIKNANVGLKNFINEYEIVLLVLFAWIFFSFQWAEYSDAASRELHRCLGSILLSLIFAINASEKKMIPWLYLTYLVLYIGAWSYAQSNIIIDVTGAYGSDLDRMNDGKLNANTMAYYTFYVSFLIFIFGDFLKSQKIKNMCRCVFFFLFPLSFLVALVTASRQVLIIQTPLLAFMLYHRYWKKVSGIYRVLAVGALCAVFFIMSGYVETLYENSYLSVRTEKNLNDDARTLLIKDSFNVGVNNFPFGVGAGNYIMYSYSHHFSHVSYLELFANQGVVGLLVFIVLLSMFIRNQWRRYNITKDKNYLLFFVFGLIFAIDNFFYVFYLDMWLISFFILVATHSKTYSQMNYVCGSGKLNYEN